MPLESGSRVGPYEIVSPLGAGGMGEVYRATDPRLGRQVAIKVLSDESSRDLEAMSRFRSEAQAVAALSHPNILAAYDFGIDRGRAFVVTELLEGETLRARIVQGKMPWRKVVEISAAIADGLAAAHEKGVIHRDIKPENIFLTTDGRVKVLDFGLARTMQPEDPDDEETTARVHTPPDVVIGTVSYMSPEQLRGSAVDTRSDIFALGCVIYEMVTGQAPFTRDAQVETIAAILKEHPPEPLDAGASVPLELNRIITRCLEKNRDERFQSARDLAFALREIGVSSITTRRPKIIAAIHRRRAGVAAAVLAVVAIATVAALWTQRANSGVREPIDSLAVMPFATPASDRDTEYLGDGITEALISSLSQLPNVRVMSQNTVFRFKGDDADPIELGKKLGVRAVLLGNVRAVGDRLVVSTELVDTSDNTQIWGEQYNIGFSDLFQLQESVAREISDRLKIQLSGETAKRIGKRQTDDDEAYRLYLQGRYHWNKRNREGIEKAIQSFRSAVEKDPEFALAHAGLADAYAIAGGYGVGSPEEFIPLAKAAANRALTIDNALAEPHTSLGHLLGTYDWEWLAAEEEFRRAIELDPNYATAHHWYALHLANRGFLDRAMSEMRIAQKLDPFSLVIGRNAARIIYFSRRYEEAIRAFEKTLHLEPNFVPALHDFAHVYEATGQYEKAVDTLEKAWGLSKDHEDLAALGRAYALAGRRADAGAALAQLKKIESYVSTFEMAALYVGLGDHDKALDALERAAKERHPQLPWVNVDPMFDPLREEPRFKKLIEEVFGAPAERE